GTSCLSGVEVKISAGILTSVPAGARADRASAELEAARPVAITGSAATGVLAFPAEVLTGDRLAALQALGKPVLLLAPTRAATLRLRQYTEEAVAVAVEDEWTSEFVVALADPAKDLDYALHGPLNSLRNPLSPEFLAAHRLVRSAGFLP